MSTATTSDAPRRSISNAQKPSNVPTSRQRLPARSAGIGSCGAMARVSNQPGVTTPGVSSMLWYHLIAATSLARRSSVTASAGMPARYQRRDDGTGGCCGPPRGRTLRSRRMRGALREGVVVRALTLAPLVVGLGLMTAMAVILRRTYGGDAAIYLPYARNLADGHPFSFNPGQFSSGSTSPLWVVVLSVPYLLGLGYQGAKAFAVLSTGGAYVASFLAARRVSGSAPAAGIAALWVVAALPLYGLIMFESSLVVLVVALGLWLLAPLRRRRAAAVGARQLAPLVVAWAALPLARPEAAVLVPIEAGALLLSWHGGRRQLGRLALAVGIASLPALAYYGYSLARLGVPSTSVAGRALYLRETSTHRLGPLFRSSEGLDYLTSWPAVAAFVPGVAGLVLLARRAGMRVLAWTALAGVGAYVFLVTFVSPGAFDTPRYLLPIAPLLVVGIALAIRALPGAPLQVAGALAAAAVLEIASGQTVDGAHNLASTPYSFDTITQRSAAGIV